MGGGGGFLTIGYYFLEIFLEVGQGCDGGEQSHSTADPNIRGSPE